MPLATVTSKGQITIPKKIRKLLNLESGDRIDFRIDDDGRIIIEPATIDISELKACLHKPGVKPVSTEEMNKVIRNRHGRHGKL